MTVFKIQELIHRFDVGAGARIVKMFAIVAAFIGVAVLYDSLCFRNLSTEEAMDASQLARNISDGKGFKTDVVRPFSMYLVSRHRADKSPLVEDRHPDLANAPLYPLFASVALKLVPPEDLTEVRRFSVARADLVLAIVNQCLLLGSALLVFILARRLFDRAVAAVSALVFVGTEIYWRFSISGLSTNLLIVLVLMLAWFLLRINETAREQRPLGRVLFHAAAAGLCLGMLGLGRYSLLCLVVPVSFFVLTYAGRARAASLAVLLFMTALVVSPWIARNIQVSGTPFGTAGFAFAEHTDAFPADRLQRSIDPDLGLPLSEYVEKLSGNLREVISADLPRIADNWVWAFFAAGLLLSFRSQALRELRWFTLLALITAIPVQALGKTQIWTSSPAINTENVLVVLSPLVLIFGVGAFFVLLDSIDFNSPQARFSAVTAFVAIVSLPLSLGFLPPRPHPVAFPPYYPPRIQLVANWLSPREWIMSDIPAAVAWYGDRQAVLATVRPHGEYQEVHSAKPIAGLYLTTRTTDNQFLANWMEGDTNSWPAFVMELLAKQEVPTGFPLRHAPDFFYVEGHALLMDKPRWLPAEK